MPNQPVIYYAVTYEWGENWDNNRTMRQQAQWDEHAALMDALVDEGFIVLGGPLEAAERVLLIINAADQQTVVDRFADDPWIVSRVRRIASIERWQILLDGRR